ncbi:ankyrin repeat domain-containing protein 53 [Mugil cephalus]|uniref:ankyrin repeat domain-containing protein 53 n=1 Tax=Mugil cephalus TaxID=48193 RepID=UPI001FB8016C|nr:ankyrin repeat domain-containing protein 53 [Mugil cephalus]
MASESTALHPADIGTPSKRSRAGRVADLGVGATGDARGGPRAAQRLRVAMLREVAVRSLRKAWLHCDSKLQNVPRDCMIVVKQGSFPGCPISMATMEPVNKTGKRRRGRCKNRKLSHRAPSGGQMFPAVTRGRQEKSVVSENQRSRQGLPELHGACLYGEMTTVVRLLESRLEWINSSDSLGHRPIHMVLSSQSSPNTSACLKYLLERGADVNATTDSGQTPLHLAASEDLLECAEVLVKAGADVLAKDSMGHTPLDLARIWCRRKIARFLKSCMWQAEKKEEMEQRMMVQALYRDLVDMAKQNNLNKKTLIDVKVTEWASKKGLPLLKDFPHRVQVSQYHTKCLLPEQKHTWGLSKHRPGRPQGDGRTSAKQQSAASTPRPWTMFMGLQPETPPRAPDLRDTVTVWKDGCGRQTQYITKWDGTARPTPNLPLDVLERALFPRAFPSRIASLQHFEPKDIVEVQHRGHPQGRSTSPWTEVAMHLAEVLEAGHY